MKIRHWITTVLGWIAGGALFYSGLKTNNTELMVTGAGLAGLGTAAKDYNKAD